MQETLSSHIADRLRQGQKKDDIVAALLQDGHEERFARDIVNETAKMRNARALQQGLTLILIGGLMALASCIITIMSSFSSQGFGIVLYGMTTAGIVLIFAGFTKIF